MLLKKGNFVARVARTDADRREAQILRYQAFQPALASIVNGVEHDEDEFDGKCDHILIEDVRTGQLVCCFRLLQLSAGHDIEGSYSAQFYALDGLKELRAPIIEMGRFCTLPGHSSPDVLRAAWAATAKYVDYSGAELLFGCSSFKGTDTSTYADAFALLNERHLAPRRWLPKVKAPNVFRFTQLWRRKPDLKKAMAAMPPLLKSYLSLGGWVSDHAVIDQHMNTVHVFTGVEIGAIPAARKRSLRAIAG